MTEHDKRWEAMTKQLDREYRLTWIKLVVYILSVVGSIGLAYLIWNSGLPAWLKCWLI